MPLHFVVEETAVDQRSRRLGELHIFVKNPVHSQGNKSYALHETFEIQSAWMASVDERIAFFHVRGKAAFKAEVIPLHM